MNNRIIGLHIKSGLDSEQNSMQMKAICKALYETGKITFSQFLFPYVDSLLLSDENEAGFFFGSHALMWDIDRCTLEKCINNIGKTEYFTAEYNEIDFNAADISAFFGETAIHKEYVGLGCFSALITGNITPWSVREHARGFCSFTEHIARMKNCSVHGLSADYISASIGTEVDENELARLYASKTGGILRIKRS